MWGVLNIQVRIRPLNLTTWSYFQGSFPSVPHPKLNGFQFVQRFQKKNIIDYPKYSCGCYIKRLTVLRYLVILGCCNY